MSKEAPCSGHTRRVARRRPSLRRACACVQMLSSANTPSRVWQITSSRPPTAQARMLPTPSPASSITAANSAMALSERHLGLEDPDGLTADPDALELAVRELEIDLDASRAVHVVTLDAGKVGAVAARRQQTELREVGAEQAMRVAAH